MERICSQGKQKKKKKKGPTINGKNLLAREANTFERVISPEII